ncbi:hypothetical protein V1478_003492 [Vespula squamosa]|uniref:Uncharacterized protein n=1 Tax=Vespula squamosa TaxID=30214 RepID=A0ABD2BLY5_VESSQ
MGKLSTPRSRHRTAGALIADGCCYSNGEYACKDVDLILFFLLHTLLLLLLLLLRKEKYFELLSKAWGRYGSD